MNWMYIAIGTAPFALLVGYICGNKTRHRQELQLKSDEFQKLESEISQREATLKELMTLFRIMSFSKKVLSKNWNINSNGNFS